MSGIGEAPRRRIGSSLLHDVRENVVRHPMIGVPGECRSSPPLCRAKRAPMLTAHSAATDLASHAFVLTTEVVLGHISELIFLAKTFI